MKYTCKNIDFKSIKEMPAQSRPRERLQQVGSGGLSDLELLCIILGSGSSFRPVQDIAEDILDLISLRGARNVTETDLRGVPGLGPAKASGICACLELGRRFTSPGARPLKDPAAVFDEVRHYGSRKQEHFIVIMLNGAHEMIGLNVVTVGLVNRTLVHPREVFSDPLKERATAVVLAHNHPSGNLEPSPDDLEVTHRIRSAGVLLGIEVLDHIIFSSVGYRSMMECGEFL